MREEHFGMAPAEMVRAGMIVWVPNGGGQVEIVGNDPRLVYESDEQAIDQIVQVLGNPDEQRRLRDASRQQRCDSAPSASCAGSGRSEVVAFVVNTRLRFRNSRSHDGRIVSAFVSESGTDLARWRHRPKRRIPQQLVVGAGRGDATILQKDQTVAALDGREAMGDDDQGARAMECCDRRRHFTLGLIVERRGRFVEHQHGGSP